jgi:hypothetical protein
MWVCSRTRDWPACENIQAADHTQLQFQFSARKLKLKLPDVGEIRMLEQIRLTLKTL